MLDHPFLVRTSNMFVGLNHHNSAVALAIAVLCIVIGASMPSYVAALGDSYAKLMALPLIIVLGTIFAHSRIALLLLMVAVRSTVETPLGTSRFAIGGSELGLGGLMNGFAIVIAVILAFERREKWRGELILIWGPFLGVALLGALISPDRASAIRLDLQLLSDFAIFVGAYLFVNSPKDFGNVVRIVLWSSFFPSIYGLLEFLTSGGGYDPESGGLRIQSTFSHPNVFAFYLLLVVALNLYVLKSRAFVLSTFTRISLSTYLFVLIALLGMTKTRSAWGACAALFAVYGVFFERRFLVYLAFFGGMGLLIPEVRDRIVEVTQGGSAITTSIATNSLDWRQHLWESALAWMTPSHYLFGYGVESFPFYATTFFKEGPAVNWGAHNDFVALFFELGVFGLTAFLWMYGRLLWSLKSLFKTDRLAAFILIMLVVEYLIVSSADNMLHYLTFHWYLWFSLGAGLALTRSAVKTGSSESWPLKARE